MGRSRQRAEGEKHGDDDGAKQPATNGGRLRDGRSAAKIGRGRTQEEEEESEGAGNWRECHCWLAVVIIRSITKPQTTMMRCMWRSAMHVTVHVAMKDDASCIRKRGRVTNSKAPLHKWRLCCLIVIDELSCALCNFLCCYRIFAWGFLCAVCSTCAGVSVYLEALETREVTVLVRVLKEAQGVFSYFAGV